MGCIIALRARASFDAPTPSPYPYLCAIISHGILAAPLTTVNVDAGKPPDNFSYAPSRLSDSCGATDRGDHHVLPHREGLPRRKADSGQRVLRRPNAARQGE